jgi:prolyl 4-hydroxylase
VSLRPHTINQLNNFIAGWYLEDTSICDELIAYYQQSPEKRAGIMSGGDGSLDKNRKDSTDVTLAPGDLAQRYVRAVHSVAKEYTTLYPYSTKLVPWGVVEPIGVQHYHPGGGYHAWHFERDNTTDQIARRHLVFMTYLNDVDDEGGTTFFYQNLTTKPEKGLTLIWPADWTFTHKGVVSPTQHKYIVTGWFSTYTQEQFMNMRNRMQQAR